MDCLEAQLLANYITEKEYPEGYGKAQKRSLRKRAQPFTVENKMLYHVTLKSDGISTSKKAQVVIGGVVSVVWKLPP